MNIVAIVLVHSVYLCPVSGEISCHFTTNGLVFPGREAAGWFTDCKQ